MKVRVSRETVLSQGYQVYREMALWVMSTPVCREDLKATAEKSSY